MSSGKSLDKTTTKYHCMVSGQKVMTPCDGCSNPKGCLSRAMQYKENEEMENLDEKGILKITADGEVSECAKGLDSGKCGFKAGAKVCGACGAMPVAMKGAMPAGEGMDDEDMEDEEMLPRKSKKRLMAGDEMSMDDEDDDEDDEDDEDDVDEKGYGTARQAMDGETHTMPDGTVMPGATHPKKKKKAMGVMAPAMDDEDENDEEDDEKGYGASRRRMKRGVKGPGMMKPGEEDEEDDDDLMMRPQANDRRRAMQAMGMKSAAIADLEDAYLCQIQRKVYESSTDVCSGCQGGCAPEEGMPGLLDIEGMALGLFGGKVLSSGYSDGADLYVVDLLAKDGRAIEIIADGSTGEIVNFHRLNSSDSGAGIAQKSANAANLTKIIDIASAEKIALKTLSTELRTDGMVVQADSDLFEGFDSYVFEIDAINGKSYDVFVGVDGSVLGYDEYEAGEAEEIEAEAADIALKRAYSDDEREDMSKSGVALPDGSYPIKDEMDLRNAVQAYGRAKDKVAAMAHIKKRAKDLGKEDLIPENWSGSEKSNDSNLFMKSLMEFQLLEMEEELKDKF